jgi:uncharacterized protein HemX
VAAAVAAPSSWAREAVIGILAILLLAVGIFSWMQEHDARLKAEAQTAAQQKTIDQAAKDAQTVQQNLDAQMKTLEAERQAPATAPQIVIDAAKMFPGLAAPLQVVQPAPVEQTVNGKTEEIPSAPVVQIPQVDFAALQQGAITCQENSAKLDACTLTQADTQTELTQTKAQASEWEKTAKGGTWLHRAVTAAKWVVIGVAAGYVAGKL